MNKIIVPQKVFLFVTIVFGFIMVVVTPPFKVPDEINHFYRAWQVSTGTFSSQKLEQRLGGFIPKSFDKLSQEFYPYTLNPYNRISPKEIYSTRLIDLNLNDTIFKDFPNTALYSAILYFPQALGISVGYHVNLNPLWLVYLGRLCNLIIYIIIGYFIIKLVPFKKWFFVVLMTLPMTISIHASLSADTILNELCFLWIAYVLKLSLDERIKRVDYKHFIALILLAILIGMSKLVYVPILLILLLIPSAKFVNIKFRIVTLISVITIGLGTALIQKSVVDSKYIPYSEYNKTYRDQTILKEGVDINKQIDFITSNKKETLSIFAKSFSNEFSLMTSSYIGLLGWGDINLPKWFIYMMYLIIFSLVIVNWEDESKYKLSFIGRSWLGLIVLALLVLIMLSQYLSWDLVGENKVYPLQGRYFISVFPLFFLIFSNLFRINASLTTSHWFSKGVLVICIFSGSICIYSMTSNASTLYEYTNPKWSVSYSFKKEATCAHENDIKYIITGIDTVAVFCNPQKNAISSENVFTGNSSLKLSKNYPYGFTLKILKGNKNDKIIASCRTNNDKGYFVVQEQPEGLYYQSEKTYYLKDSLGRCYKEVQFVLPYDIRDSKELKVFFWCPNDSNYLDDFHLLYFEK
jgi:uncharacterized membrane protein